MYSRFLYAAKSISTMKVSSGSAENKWPAFMAPLIMMLTTLLFLLSGCEQPKPKDVPRELILTRLDGKQVPIEAFRGKLLVLNVWASWCPPCRREMPSLERLSKTADINHIAVAGIATDESVNAVREFISLHNITFDIFTDTPMNVAKVLGTRVYPETVLIAPDGEIIHRIAGERDWDSPAMLKALEDAYQGKRNASDFSQAATSSGNK